jgi:hypothetical protein
VAPPRLGTAKAAGVAAVRGLLRDVEERADAAPWAIPDAAASNQLDAATSNRFDGPFAPTRPGQHFRHEAPEDHPQVDPAQRPGGSVAGGVNVVVAANVDEPGDARTSVSSGQRVVQRGGRTEATFEGPEERRPRGAEQADEGPVMTDRTGMQPHEYKPLTREELTELAGEELPERAAMSLINANVAAPINAAVALNVASDGSTAYANAQQTATIDQST